METGDKKIEKNKSIMKILISGIIILSICLVACLIHVIDIRLSFSKEITEQFSHQLFSSKQLLNENIDSATMVAEDMAEQLGNLSQQHKSESIFNIIMSQNSIFDEVIYIRDDSLVYSSTGIISSRRDNEKWNTKNIKKNETISVRNVKIKGKIGRAHV